MTVGEIVYRVLGDDSQFKKVMGNVGLTADKVLSAISKTALAVTGAAATAVGVLAKEATASFGDYEQLAGGAKLMYGEAYDYIAEKAKTAFKDVQMSQNNYLEQVNGFAIGLKTALGGNELAAATLADRIVTAEADIVAATGNTAENVQNAFNGIMKSNYTMLDNLQIGITPTKEGFQELIDKVNAYKEAHGEATNYTIDNLADCQNALVDYIEMQGLSGYAQAEGADTLSGSMASMKAAWQNMLTGMADPTQDFDELVSNLVDSIINVSDNLMPRVMAILPQMATGITQLAGDLLPLIPETLEQMLPDVLDGANNLISALLDTLSSIADTAIPIVTDNADEIIDTLLTGLVDSVPNLASKAADLCTALITAILDNADIITQGSVDVVTALAEGISDNLDELIPAAVEAVIKIAETITDFNNLNDIIDSAFKIIKSLADGLIDAIVSPDMLPKLAEIVVNIGNGLIKSVVGIIPASIAICEKLAETIVNYDWEPMSSNVLERIDEALKKAVAGGIMTMVELTTDESEYKHQVKDYSNYTKETIDSMVNSAQARLDELQRVMGNAGLQGEFIYQNIPQWIRKGAEGSGQTLEQFIGNQINQTELFISDLKESYKNAKSEIKETAEDIDNTVNNIDADSSPDPGVDGVISKSEMLDAALKDLEDKYAVHKVTEEQYWSDRKAYLEKYRNEESAEWWKLYDEVTSHYEKLADTESKAAQTAAKEQESALKQAVEDKFRELETEQLEKSYDDTWLLEQKRAFIETLDHNSDIYKDYNLKLLKEQKSADEKALKELENAAQKQENALKSSYERLIKSRDSLASSLNQSGDIFKSSEETDKRTGAKKRSNSYDTSEYERKLAAKKKLTSKIAELYEKNAPDSLVRSLLKKDPEDALAQANQLLRDSKKLSEIKSLFKEDETVNNTLANIVTENSKDFKVLGEEAGCVFGEGFTSAFRSNWEDTFKTVFSDEEYKAQAAVQVKAANSTAAVSTAVRRDHAADAAAVSNRKANAFDPQRSDLNVRVLNLNGTWLADAVVKASDQKKIISGG